MGSLFALLSAMSFAFNDVAIRRGVLYDAVHKSIAVTVPIGVPLFLITIFLFDCVGHFSNLSGLSIFLFSLAGIIHFVFGRYCNYKSIECLGTTLAGPIMQASLLVSLFFAYFILNENLTHYHIIGIILILLGPIVILVTRKDKITKSGVAISYKAGFIWGILCAISYGSSPLLIKLASNNGGLKLNIIGGFISYLSASIFLFILMIAFKISMKDIYRLEKEGKKWFVITGFTAFISQLLRYMALALLPMSTVEPIQRTSTVFRVLFGYLLNRNHEIINLKVILGILLSLLGAYILIIQLNTIN